MKKQTDIQTKNASHSLHNILKAGNNHALLFKLSSQENCGGFISGYIVFGKEKEEWQEEKEEPPKEILSFVSEIKSAKELAAIVRKDPLAKYVLFKGQMVGIHVAMPVFIDGKNVETQDCEWL